MKDDEERLLIAIYNHYTLFLSEQSIRDIIQNSPLIQIPYKRCMYILEKWVEKGWYDYGVSLDLGWLTEEGKAEAKRIGG